MTSDEIIRRWKKEGGGQAPPNPAGTIELPDEDLDDVAGATSYPCAAIASVAVSCYVSCNTIIKGTCGGGSYGCCGPEIMAESVE